MSDELIPITRKEIFLAKAGGQNVVTPTPITREEIFLQSIIDNGSGGGGGGGGDNVMIVTLTYDEDADDGTYISSATATEIVAANSDGKAIIGKIGYGQFFISVIEIFGEATITGLVARHTNNGVEYDYLVLNAETNKWKKM